MTAVELLPAAEAVPSNPAWHKLRAEGVSASEIAAVLGISPWDSPFSLYWQKLNGWQSDENPEMAAGKRAESVIADWYADVADPIENLRLDRAGLYASAERPWQLATPDRLIYGFGDDGMPTYETNEFLVALLECKYVIGGWDGWGEPWTDQVPVHYRAQCLWQLDVMGVDEVHLAAWHGADLRVYQIMRDEGDLRIMRAAGKQFHDRLLAGDPPDVDSHTATIRTLRALHPDLEDRDQDITAGTADGYRRARAVKARAAAMCDRFEARLRAEMGSARRGVHDGRTVASRSIFTVAESVRAAYTVDRLNPARGSKKP